ncbi:MAG: 1-acyl-sn-glycerol-3-phosphate acyltransferase [Gammaproteobacteria bacterium]|nr:1-acyl-sn-glycerol-3-phosphate acyltransferase [Gammaproteobacteria bacterium]
MTTESSFIDAHHARERHIVDVLIEERAVNLMKHPATWRLIRTLRDGILGYDKAVRMADSISTLRGREVFDYMSDLLKLKVHATGVESIPKSGRALVTPNHPAGIADGIAVYDALKDIRDDIVFLANRDAIRVSAGLSEIIVPVEWRDDFRTPKRNRETIHALVRAIKDERLVVIFPSGRLARPTIKGLKERPWQITALNLAQKYEIPVVPMNIKGHNTLFYYLTWFVNQELKDMTLFRELLNKSGQKYRLTIGEAFESKGDPQEDTEQLREFVLNHLSKGITKYR